MIDYDRIKLIILDIDGTMTDGSIYYDSQGHETKSFHVKDGLGIKVAVKSGIQFAIITGRKSPMVGRRAKELGINYIMSGIEQKKSAMIELMELAGVESSEVGYIGDDWNDLQAMQMAAYRACPADAADEIKAICSYVSPYAGGHGAVRSCIEYLMQKQGKWKTSAENLFDEAAGKKENLLIEKQTIKKKTCQWIKVFKDKSIILKYPLLIGLLYSFLLFLLVYLFAYPTWEGADDFVVSGMLSGVTGESSPYVLVISYPLSSVLHLLQTWIPRFNWLTILEIFAVWISFSVFIWIFLRKKTAISYWIAFVMPLVFEVPFYMSLNYTRSACLLAFSGLFLIYYCKLEVSSNFGSIIGILLFVLGSLTRFACIFLPVPFVGIWLVLYYTKRLKTKRINIRRNIAFWGFILGAFALALGFQQYHTYKYNQFEEANGYIEFNSLRARAFDYLPKDYTEYEEEFKQIGISNNDYEMIRHFIIYDDYYNEDLYEKIIAINNSENESLSRKWKAVSKRFLTDVAFYTSGKMTEEWSDFILFIITVGVAALFLRKNTLFSFLCAVGGTLVITFYFIWTGRFPPWIQDSLYFMGSITLLYGTIRKGGPRFLKTNKEKMSRRGMTIIKTSCILLSVAALGMTGQKVWEMSSRHEIDEQLCIALDYMENDKENIYLIDNFSRSPYPIIYAYGNLRGLRKGSWSNIVRMGSWFIKHPVLNMQLQELGITSPIRNLINENVYLFTKPGVDNIHCYQIFLQEHYNITAEPVLVHQWGNYAVYTMRMKE